MGVRRADKETGRLNVCLQAAGTLADFLWALQCIRISKTSMDGKNFRGFGLCFFFRHWFAMVFL